MEHPLVLFGLDTTRPYADRVAARLGLALAPAEERDFEDGEHRARPLADPAGRHAVVIHSLHADAARSVNDKLCRLLFFCAALKDAGAASVTAVAPYLCYARSDRRTKPLEPVIHRYVAAAMEACGIDAVVTVDVHNLAAFENAHRVPAHNAEAAPLLAQPFATLEGDCVAVSPDAGGLKRVEAFRVALEARLGRPVGTACMAKVREAGQVTGRLLSGHVEGKAAVIVDDIISTGATLLHAVRACRDAGARRIFAAAAHGLFTAGAGALVEESALERIVVLDTVPPFRLPQAAVARRLSVLDSTALVAAAIRAAVPLT